MTIYYSIVKETVYYNPNVVIHYYVYKFETRFEKLLYKLGKIEGWWWKQFDYLEEALRYINKDLSEVRYKEKEKIYG